MRQLSLERRERVLVKTAKINAAFWGGTRKGEAIRALGGLADVSGIGAVSSAAMRMPRKVALKAVVQKVELAKAKGLSPTANLDKSEKLLYKAIQKPKATSEYKAKKTFPISRFTSHGAGHFLSPVHGVSALAMSPFKGKQKIMMRGMRGRISKAVQEGKKPTTYLSKDQKEVYSSLKQSQIDKMIQATKKRRVGVGVAAGATAGGVTLAALSKSKRKASATSRKRG